MVNFIERSNLVKRQSYDTALLCYCLKNALANPPYGIGNELETTCFIKLLRCFDETDVAFINQVSKSKPLMLVLFCHRNDKTKVGRHQFVLGSFTLWTAFAYLLRKLYLLVNGNKWSTTNLYKVFIQGFT